MTLTNEQIEQYRKIVKNAPEGATHTDADGCYIKTRNDNIFETSVYFHWGDEWQRATNACFCLSDSLDNLRTIISLHDEIERLRVRDSRLSKAADKRVEENRKEYMEALSNE